MKTGLESPYRYDCNEVDCTPLDDYVWRDNKDFSYEQVAEYGNLVGLRPVKSFVLNMTSQNWLTGKLSKQDFCFTDFRTGCFTHRMVSRADSYLAKRD